jgi:phage terminase large subunit-like protein
VRGEWNRAALIELTDFPFGTNDDQVDAMASAYNKAAEGHQLGAAVGRRFW